MARRSQSTGSNTGTRSCLIAGVSAALALAYASGCAPRREPEPAISSEQAARLGVGTDAADPTRRDLDEGYYRWKEKPESDGTRSKLDPSRRKIGGPNP